MNPLNTPGITQDKGYVVLGFHLNPFAQQLMSIKDLNLGNINIGFPVVQAALSGYSDWPMRVIAKQHGASYTVCEVMLDKFLVDLKERKRTSHFLHISADEHPVGGQLMGSEPEQFAAGASRLVDAGFDIIDINFGCPVKKVLGKYRGGFHLGQPKIALEIVKRTRETVPAEIPVTVKMRRGIDDSSESKQQFFSILEGAFDLGIAGVTVHGRTVKQKYVGPSQWGFLKEVKTAFGDKVILGSGDLFTPESCLEMIAETGVDGVTVARGAIGNPWIFEQALALAHGKQKPGPPSLFRQRKVIQEHYRLAEELYGERSGPIMRKFGIKYSALHPRHVEVRQSFNRVRNFDQWKQVLDQWYSEDLAGVYPDGRLHKAQGSCETG